MNARDPAISTTRQTSPQTVKVSRVSVVVPLRRDVNLQWLTDDAHIFATYLGLTVIPNGPFANTAVADRDIGGRNCVWHDAETNSLHLRIDTPLDVAERLEGLCGEIERHASRGFYYALAGQPVQIHGPNAAARALVAQELIQAYDDASEADDDPVSTYSPR